MKRVTKSISIFSAFNIFKNFEKKVIAVVELIKLNHIKKTEKRKAGN